MAQISHNERLHAMDALRAIAMLLGVVLHAALPYEADPWPVWPIIDSSNNAVFDYTIAIIHQFRMELFFLVAGFFGCMLIGRYGARGFAMHRAKRIALPYVVSSLTILPMLFAISAWCATLDLPVEERSGFGTAARDGLREVGGWMFFLPWHLWFLRTLMVLYVLAMIAWLAGRKIGVVGAVSSGLTEAWAAAVRAGLAAPTLSLFGFLFLLLHPGLGAYLDGLNPFPAPITVMYYALFFGAGWLLYHRRELLPSLGRGWPVWLVIGIALAAWFGSMTPPFEQEPEAHPMLIKAVGAASTGPLIVGFTGLFLRAFQRPSRVMRYLSDSAYWVYLVHLPVVIWFPALIRPMDAGAITKFSLAMLASCALMYGTYQLFVRYTLIGVMLNGPAIRNARRAAKAPPAPAGLNGHNGTKGHD